MHLDAVKAAISLTSGPLPLPRFGISVLLIANTLSLPESIYMGDRSFMLQPSFCTHPSPPAVYSRNFDVFFK